MDDKIREILRDLYEREPSLKVKETELKKVIHKLFSSRPDTHIDVQFQSDLKDRLLQEYSIREKKRKAGILTWLKMRSVQRVLGGAVLSVLIFMVSLNVYQTKKDQSTFKTYAYVEEAEIKEDSISESDSVGQYKPLSPEAQKLKAIDDVQVSPQITEEVKDKELEKGKENSGLKYADTKQEMLSLAEEELTLPQETLSSEDKNFYDEKVKMPDEDQDQYVGEVKATEKSKKVQKPNLIQRLMDNSKKKSNSSLNKSMPETEEQERSEVSDTIMETPTVSKQDTRPMLVTGYSLDILAQEDTPLSNPLVSLPLSVRQDNYMTVRNKIQNNTDLPKHAIKTEQLVQHFIYDYPRGRSAVTIHSELGQSAWSDDKVLLQLAVQTRAPKSLNNKAHNVVILIDITDNNNKNDKVSRVKDAVHDMAKNLRKEDTIALIIRKTGASAILEPTHDSLKIMSFLEKVYTSPHPAGYDSFQLAYDLTQLNTQQDVLSHVIYLGDSKLQRSSSLTEILKKYEQKDIGLTMLDLSTSVAVSSDYQSIASLIAGKAVAANSIYQMKKIMLATLDYEVELMGTQFSYDIQFNPTVVNKYRVLGYQNKNSSSGTPEKMLYSGITTTVLFEISLHDSQSLKQINSSQIKGRAWNNSDLATIRYSYYEADSQKSILHSQTVSSQVLALDQTSADFKLVSALWLWELLLTDSPYKGRSTLSGAIELAQQSLVFDPQGLRQDFVQLLNSNRAKTFLKNSDSTLDMLESK